MFTKHGSLYWHEGCHDMTAGAQVRETAAWPLHPPSFSFRAGRPRPLIILRMDFHPGMDAGRAGDIIGGNFPHHPKLEI